MHPLCPEPPHAKARRVAPGAGHVSLHTAPGRLLLPLLVAQQRTHSRAVSPDPGTTISYLFRYQNQTVSQLY